MIFALPPAELALHPDAAGCKHEPYLMCDDIRAAVEELRGKGVEFEHEISGQGMAW